jgi:CBS domain-containing protein
VTTVTPDKTVEDALAIFKEKSIRNIPVVDAEGKFLGLFGLKEVLFNLLPKAVTMEDGLANLDFVVDAAPGIAKRLRKLDFVPVSELMNKSPNVVYTDTSTIEALRIIALHGSPVPVVDEESGSFKGIISRKTLLSDLTSLLEEIEKEKEKAERTA